MRTSQTLAEIQRRKETDPNADAWDKVKYVAGVASGNLKGTAQLVASQIPNSAAALGGMWAGAKGGAALGLLGGAAAPVTVPVGAFLGGLAGMFLGNFALESGGKAMEKAADGFTSQDASDSLVEGAKKAAVVTAVDRATMGLGGLVANSFGKPVIRAGARAEAKVLADAGVDITDGVKIAAALSANQELRATAKAAGEAAAKSASSLSRRATQAGTGLAMETGGEGVGEYYGEEWATGKGDVYDAALESIASLSQSLVQTTGAMRNAAPEGLSPQEIQRFATALAPNPLAQKLQEQVAKGNSTLSNAVLAADPTIAVDHRSIVEQLRVVDPQMASAYMDNLNISQNQQAPQVAREQAKARLMEQVQALQQHNQALAREQAGQPYRDMGQQPEGASLEAQKALAQQRSVGVAGQQYQDLGLQPQSGSLQEQKSRETAGQQWQDLGIAQDAPGATTAKQALTEAGAAWAEINKDRIADGETRMLPTKTPPQPGGVLTGAEQTSTGETNGNETAKAVQAETKGQETSKPRKQVEAPHVFIPAAEGANANLPTVVRKRKAQLSTMVAKGFTDVERRGNEFFLVNTKDNSELKLDNAGDAARAHKAIADHKATLVPTEQNSLAGAPIDKEWTAFAPSSGTLNIPRSEMPQIKSEHRGAMANFLNARGIRSTTNEVDPNSLKPTQMEFSPAKVKKAQKFEGPDRPVLVSNDGHILDGHHQWLAKKANGEKVKIIRLDAPIEKLLTEMKAFPSAGMTKEVASATTPVYAQQQTTGVGNDGKDTGAAGAGVDSLEGEEGGGAPSGGRISASASGPTGDGHSLDTRSRGREPVQAPGTIAVDGAEAVGQRNATALERVRATLTKYKADRQRALANTTDPKTRAKLQAEIDRTPEVPEPTGDALRDYANMAAAWEGAFGEAVTAYADPKSTDDGFKISDQALVNLSNPKMPLAFTLAHEFKHLIENVPGIKALYDRIYSLIPESAKQEYLPYLHRTRQVSTDVLSKATADDLTVLRKEMVADFMGGRFVDKPWLENLAKQKPNLFGQFYRDWVNILNSLIDSIRSALGDKKNPKNIDNLMRNHLKELEEMKAIATEVAIAWAERNPKLAASTGAGPVIQNSTRDLQQEMDDERDGKVVSDDAIEAKGRMAEEAYPDLDWKKTKLQETTTAPSEGQYDQRIEMNEDLHSNLWDVGMNNTWVGPSMEENG